MQHRILRTAAAAICFISAESSEEICRRTGVRMDSCASAGSGGSMHYESYIEKGLLEHPETDGIFASSDLIAAQVLQCLYAMGKRVPEDIKVVGFDDTVIAGHAAAA
mgnify:CR=1 FL=1